jgi:hypothetical protein
MHFNNIKIFNTLSILTNSLNSNILNSDLNLDLKDKYILGENIQKKYNYNIIRIWKSKAIYSYYFDIMDISDNLLGCLDYEIKNNNIKIEYLSISDHFDNTLSDSDNFDNTLSDKKNILNDDDAYELKNSLIKYVENIAKNNNLNKIIIDVHRNLRYYNKYYKDCGFIITDRICDDNPYWIEAEKIIL